MLSGTKQIIFHMMEVVLIICTYFDCCIVFQYLDYRIITIKCAAVVAKNKFCITWKRAEMQMKWRSIMGILKDHKSYMLVPEMKEFTDLMTAYPF